MAEIRFLALFMIVHSLVLTSGFPFGGLNGGTSNAELANMGMTGNTGSLLGLDGANTGSPWSLLGLNGANTGSPESLLGLSGVANTDSLLGLTGGANMGDMGALLGLEGMPAGEQQASLLGMPIEPSGQLALRMMGLSNSGMPLGGNVPKFLRICDKIWWGCSTALNFILQKLGGPVGIANRLYNRAIDNYSKKHGIPRGEAAGQFNEVMESRLAGSFLG